MTNRKIMMMTAIKRPISVAKPLGIYDYKVDPCGNPASGSRINLVPS